MRAAWRQSILFLSTLAVIGAALVVGVLFIGRTLVVTDARLEKQSVERLNQLVDVVESTVRIACFVGDQALAKEVASGLLKDAEVLGVVLRTGERELVHAYRKGAIPGSASPLRIVRTVYSPFDPAERVGEIVLEPDHREIERKSRDEATFLGTLLALQLGTLAVTIAVVILHLVVRPIKSISDRLHRMDPVRGDRLHIPRSHGETEIGRLAGDINALADRLVNALDDERTLRRQREVDEKKYHAIFVNAETGIFIADRGGMIDSANPALARLLDLPAAAVESGCNIARLDWRAPEQVVALIQNAVDHNASTAGDLEIAVSDGNTRWLALTLSPIGDGAVQGLVSDVTERKLAEDAAKRQAVTDPLTGVANRSGFENSVQRAILACTAARSGVASPGFALILVDLDGFRKTNEALGLPVGDAILQLAAKRLRSCLKAGDTVARVGADEFALLLPEAASEEVAARIGERLVRALGQSYDGQPTPIQLGASLGIALYPEDGGDLPTLLRNSELALNRARATGGGRYAFFDHGMAEAAERQQAMEVDMQMALRNGDYRLFYQPIVDLVDGRVLGAEALIRWRHKDKGMISPDAFIPLAEENGLIVDIGLWGLETACRQIAEWQAAGKDYYLSLNVSGVQIPDGLPPSVLAEAVRRHGINPHRLILEITEGILLADVSRALAWLSSVREIGFPIYLDDFGTGYSSLSYLKRFPVDTVKIDQSFVRDMGSDNSDRALVEAIVAMARSLRLEVVAEGVETALQLGLLRDMGCRRVQGYYFSRPVPADEFGAAVDRIDALLAGVGSTAGASIQPA
jgi:diguanylate cyclase (GGDEF)-like protein/PAS domain S-box-containing protein